MSFNRSGFVTPNNQLGGTITVEQNFDFRGASLEAVALLRQESSRIRDETIAAVEQRNTRGINAARR